MAQTCTPGGSVTTLGAAGQTTTLSGGATYSGAYQVLGDLVLTNGTYTLTPGTIFYVDGLANRTASLSGGYQRNVSGCTITVDAYASLVLDGATMTASGSTVGCPMWRGVVLSSTGQGPSGPYRLVVKNNSTISHALCGIDMQNVTSGWYTGTNTYLLDHSTFAYNIRHVRDQSYHPTGPASLITNCTFDSEPAQMRFPYEQTSAGDKYYAYEALCLKPLGDYTSNAVEVRNNTINNAVYGIVNNEFDRAGVLIQGNTLNKIFQTGIWTVNNDTNGGTTAPVVSNNFIGMNVYPPQNTDQIDPTATVFGIVGENIAFPNSFVANTIIGDNSGTAKPLVGLSISLQTDASGNFIENMNEDFRTTELDGSDIFDNHTNDCDDAFVVQPSPNGIYNLKRLGCNTFAQPSYSASSRGLVVQQNALINDIGSFSSPAANQFNNLGTSIYNDGSFFTYYKTSSSQEPVSLLGGGTTNVQTVFVSRRNLVDYCLNRGAANGNGVNARGTTVNASYVAALMDSVRRQLVSPARSQGYLHEVVSYYRDAQQLPALEAWWPTLAVPNAAAYRTVGRYLLQTYDAQRVLAGLQPAALLNAELAAQLQLRAVLRHLPQTTPRLVAADSVVLRMLAWSGTSVAAPAGRWLRYYHPRIALPAATPAPRLAAKRKTVLIESGAVLGAAYPNPAQTEVTITCQLPQADQAAELRFTNLLTGQVQLVVPVAGTGTERSQRISVQKLSAGQYAYQLLVNGQLVAAPQKLVVNP